MNEQFLFYFRSCTSVCGETYQEGTLKYWVTNVVLANLDSINSSYPRLIVSDDNSDLANSIRNNPAGGVFFLFTRNRRIAGNFANCF